MCLLQENSNFLVFTNPSIIDFCHLILHTAHQCMQKALNDQQESKAFSYGPDLVSGSDQCISLLDCWEISKYYLGCGIKMGCNNKKVDLKGKD